MNEEQPSYKVTDRRLFNADGTPRELPEEAQLEKKTTPTETPTGASTQGAVQAEPATTPGAGSGPSPDQRQTPAESEPEHVHEESRLETELPGAEDPASFASFMMSIASNAASALGMMEHPVTGKREVDLELGKHWIDVLGMLQQKTRGNLLVQEQQILEGLLADLRMQFVSLTNTTPKARGFSSRDITGG
ncbi:MAG TPA: DUF1844 domain-containing protein [Pyrinomonadaceae bacterium]|jgi:hypothetical protein|nr:DUF1844 domain-containing protein [Pyrinomonadaceae bacterium]